MKKIISILITVSLVALLLSACGDKEDKTAGSIAGGDPDIQAELDKEEEEILKEVQAELESNDVAEDYTDAPETEEEAPEESEAPKFELVQVSDEIKNSKITDEIVQVGNAVIPNDMSLTVQEVMELLSIDGEVVVGGGNSSYNNDSLIPADGHAPDRIEISRREKNTGSSEDVICILEIKNDSDSPISVMKCHVTDIYAVPGINALNFYYPGNICAFVISEVCHRENMDLVDVYKEYKDAIETRRSEAEYYDVDYETGVKYLENLTKAAGVEPKVLDESSSIPKYRIEIVSKEIVPGVKDPWDGSVHFHREIVFTYHFSLTDNKLTLVERGTGLTK